MSILKPNPPYDLFEEVNVGRRTFIVQEDHTAATPFYKKMLIGFGGLLLAAALLMIIVTLLSGAYEQGVGELPYLSAFSSVFGQERRVVEKALRSGDAEVTYDPGIKGYRLKEPVEFAGHQFDVTLSYGGDDRLSSVMYTLPSYDDAGMMASIAHQLIANTQDAWGYSQGSIFTRRYIKWDHDDLKKAFASAEPWQQEITWILNEDNYGLVLEEGSCVSVCLCVDYPGDGEKAQVWFTVGFDTPEAGDFTYTPG